MMRVLWSKKLTNSSECRIWSFSSSVNSCGGAVKRKKIKEMKKHSGRKRGRQDSTHSRLFFVVTTVHTFLLHLLVRGLSLSLVHWLRRSSFFLFLFLCRTRSEKSKNKSGRFDAQPRHHSKISKISENTELNHPKAAFYQRVVRCSTPSSSIIFFNPPSPHKKRNNWSECGPGSLSAAHLFVCVSTMLPFSA